MICINEDCECPLYKGKGWDKMTNELLAVKLCELDRRGGKLHGRLLEMEHAPQEVLQQDIEALRRECTENEQMLRNNLRFSRAPSVAVLYQAYIEVEEVLDRLRKQMEQEREENKAAQSGELKEASVRPEIDPVEEKLLLAEYAIDFAMQAADRALLISMEAVQAEGRKPEAQ